MRKAVTQREIPPPLELECLKALWTLGEANVRGIRQALLPRRSLAYTTVMTIMDRLARRGAVDQRKVGRSFMYAPVLSRETLRRLAVRELVDAFFSGSEEELVSYLRAQQSQPESQTPEPRAMAAAAGVGGAGEAVELDPALL
jgi:predicted transcriptional regulator